MTNRSCKTERLTAGGEGLGFVCVSWFLSSLWSLVFLFSSFGMECWLCTCSTHCVSDVCGFLCLVYVEGHKQVCFKAQKRLWTSEQCYKEGFWDLGWWSEYVLHYDLDMPSGARMGFCSWRVTIPQWVMVKSWSSALLRTGAGDETFCR